MFKVTVVIIVRTLFKFEVYLSIYRFDLFKRKKRNETIWVFLFLQFETQNLRIVLTIAIFMHEICLRFWVPSYLNDKISYLFITTSKTVLVTV